jgi:hypothetical protein
MGSGGGQAAMDFENLATPLMWLAGIFVLIMVFMAKSTVVERRTIPSTPHMGGANTLTTLANLTNLKKTPIQTLSPLKTLARMHASSSRRRLRKKT